MSVSFKRWLPALLAFLVWLFYVASDGPQGSGNLASNVLAKAEMFVGFTYETGGIIVQEDKVKAAEWFRKAAERGYADAQLMLGGMYDDGEGVPQDKVDAYVWFLLAASRGNKFAPNISYWHEHELTADEINAAQEEAARRAAAMPEMPAAEVNRLLPAAEQGDAEAQYLLGMIYHRGKAVLRDYRETAKWHRKAAQQGHAEAQAVLAALHYNGRGVAQDGREALQWSRKAAEMGHAAAQYNLGDFYLNGNVVDADAQEAYVWFSLSAAQGDADAQETLDKLAKDLTPAEIASAQDEAARRAATYQ